MELRNVHSLQNLWQRIQIEIVFKLFQTGLISTLIEWTKLVKKKNLNSKKNPLRLEVVKTGQVEQLSLKSLNLSLKLIDQKFQRHNQSSK